MSNQAVMEVLPAIEQTQGVPSPAGTPAERPDTEEPDWETFATILAQGYQYIPLFP